MGIAFVRAVSYSRRLARGVRQPPAFARWIAINRVRLRFVFVVERDLVPPTLSEESVLCAARAIICTSRFKLTLEG